jgi:hypothetical protein
MEVGRTSGMKHRGSLLERGFEQVGRFVAKRPGVVVPLALLVSVALASGYFLLDEESRPEKLWVPDGATAISHNDYVRSTWPSSQRFNFWAAKCRGTDCNIFDSKYIARLADIDAQIKALVVDGARVVQEYDSDYLSGQSARPWAKFAGYWSFGGTAGSKSKCFQQGTQCVSSSIVDLFSGGLPATNAASLATINAAVASGVTLSRLAGGLVMSTSTTAASATAVSGSYQLTLDDVFIESTGRRADPLAEEWEAAALCVLGIDAADDDPFSNCVQDDLLEFSAQFARSLSDEFSDAIGNDVAMIATAYALIFVYLLVALSRWDPVHSMIGLSFVVILIVALSYAGCLGLGGLLGVKNNALTNIGLNVLLRSRYSVVLEANRRRRRSTRRRYNTTKFTFRRTRISADVFLFH